MSSLASGFQKIGDNPDNRMNRKQSSQSRNYCNGSSWKLWQDAFTTTPASNPNILTVSAIGDSDGKCGGLGPALPRFDGNASDDTMADFSNFGPVVKIAAPGVNIFSTYNGTGHAI